MLSLALMRVSRAQLETTRTSGSFGAQTAVVMVKAEWPVVGVEAVSARMPRARWGAAITAAKFAAIVG